MTLGAHVCVDYTDFSFLQLRPGMKSVAIAFFIHNVRAFCCNDDIEELVL